ncbi:MAG: polymerase epsilon subunit-like 3-5 exonuclease, partial [Alphaproteobacteria bacterium]|nr:polymerase epsilon subunit-like 3-5 exonuclease [Alphaproteobacteria bacterium]
FDWVCTVNVARSKWPELANHKLNTVSKHLNIELNHHDAASDAHACANIYLRACEADIKAA